MIVHRADPGDEFATRERCHITELLNHARNPALSVARCRVEPGVTTELHALTATAEIYVLIEGAAQMDDGTGLWRPVAAMDCIEIAAGAPQRIRNTGPRDLVFLAICTPRFLPPAYRPLE
ncbi:Cupin 2 conserved barrel domain protein [Oceaniovalibus guishaninsula JLT2003]|uniref:Cupin 2 conserved barrel domain protein n=1 Tax=Oceaniovalibus guishaninsula JLT2003 TaxID=1231392 RepID=K2I2M4_9RHOB|nr:cupin domain-containing protein [Oceaniovalibus guishaninsula]EKE43100.1 Cupin 2 conserved barrel domain protein [Oceaniovalibus guishaninsula JLT2003]